MGRLKNIKGVILDTDHNRREVALPEKDTCTRTVTYTVLHAYTQKGWQGS